MARDLIQRRAFFALNQRIQFNEVLSAAYLEKQKMSVRFPRGIVPRLQFR
jgi:hypothetical protein